MPLHQEAYGFGLFMLKAVLSGRGTELMQLAKTIIFREMTVTLMRCIDNPSNHHGGADQ
jgi:hypothetical protein